MRCPITLPPSSCRKLRQHAILQHHVRHVDCSHYQPCSTVPPLMLALFLCRRRLNRTSKLRSIGLRRRSAVTSLTHNHMLMLSLLFCCWCCCCCCWWLAIATQSTFADVNGLFASLCLDFLVFYARSMSCQALTVTALFVLQQKYL